MRQTSNLEELNGCFKIGVTKAKEEILAKKKQLRFKNFKWSPTDIIPIVNSAWAVSFGVPSNGIKAVCEHAWNLLNRVLLLKKEVLNTKLAMDGTAPSSSSSSSGASTVGRSLMIAEGNQLNVNTSTATEFLDQLVEKRDHDKARHHALKRVLDGNTTLSRIKEPMCILLYMETMCIYL
jgi:hypothetical protein